MGVLSRDYPLRVINLLYSHPLQSLQDSCWFKLICGASFQHLPDVRNLTLAYALAGADCIDVAADPAVVASAREGIRAMKALVREQSVSHLLGSWIYGPFEQDSSAPEFSSDITIQSPWLMVSLNDGEDPHFRKAAFDPERCPPDCRRPCERICPADAIVFPSDWSPGSSVAGSLPSILESGAQASDLGAASLPVGVLRERCYGCGRCMPVCPIQHIEAQSYMVSPAVIAPTLLPQVDAIEIHTQVGRTEQFRTLWRQLRPHIDHLKLVAISCPDVPKAQGDSASPDSYSDNDPYIGYLRSLHHIMTDGGRQPLPGALLWQTDGRPMSGDIGKSATRATVQLAQKAIAAHLPGFVQLAGGTNDHTVPTLRRLDLLPRPPLAGVAYGSYARKRLAPVLEALANYPTHADSQSASPRQPPLSSSFRLSNEYSPNCLETVPELLSEAVQIASSLISPLKTLTQSNGTNHPIASTIPVPMSEARDMPASGMSSHVGSSVHL
ncbi:MAG: LdpA C-terminal domain-containing domain [Cyanobacteria bacterium P01_F01_bin.150]